MGHFMQRLTDAGLGVWRTARSSLRGIHLPDLLICIAGIGFAVLVRYTLLDFKSSDFLNSLKPWYVTIRDMGFSAFGTDFTTYNPPYLYELYLIARFFPDTSNLLATKIPSLIGDFIGAVFVYALVKHRYTSGPFAPLATFAFLMAPTVVLNSAFWGQADILFTAPLLAALYFLMKRRNTWAMLAFGVGLAFKLQAIFLAPLLFGLFLRGHLTWKQLIMVPLVLLAAMVPSAMAGRPILDLLGVYIFQAGQYQLLQMSAPTAYAWMPDYGLTQRFFTPGGVVFTAALGFALSILVYKTKAPVADDLLLRLSMLCFLLVPFFLPKMHDRYFYPADVLAIIFAFYYPRYFFVPIVVILSSYFAYQPTLFEVEPVPMAFLAGGMFTMLVIVARDALAHLLAPEFTDSSFAAAVE
jgi:Gpi18-like mannosyltransferase